MARLDDDSTEPLRPEELDDETWADVLERVEEGAERRHRSERERLMAAGILDAQGRLLKEPAKAIRSEDGGGWSADRGRSRIALRPLIGRAGVIVPGRAVEMS